MTIVNGKKQVWPWFGIKRQAIGKTNIKRRKIYDRD
jgi:hypothetical protein